MRGVLRVCDVETTAKEPPSAQVCEIGYVDVIEAPDGDMWLHGPVNSRLCGVDSMPPEVRAVHHITLADVAGRAPFDPKEVTGGEYMLMAIVAHQADFEKQFLGERPFPMICTYKCALRVWPEAPGHSNSVLRYWLEDQGLLKLDHEKAMPPHRAGPDAYVTAHILLALLRVATVKQLIEWTLEPRLLPKCPIGKFRGVTWDKVDWGFLSWMLRQPDMDPDLVWNAKRELKRRVDEAEAAMHGESAPY